VQRKGQRGSSMSREDSGANLCRQTHRGDLRRRPMLVQTHAGRPIRATRGAGQWRSTKAGSPALRGAKA
jgi:hypothetical protein